MCMFALISRHHRIKEPAPREGRMSQFPTPAEQPQVKQWLGAAAQEENQQQLESESLTATKECNR